MALRRLQVTDFRCLQSAQLELDPRFTLISGPNASGKTSVLEAIYLLGRGRSFRTRRTEQLIRKGSDRFVLFGEIEAPDRRFGVGVEGVPTGIRGKIGGEFISSLAELALALPVQIIDPEVHRLIEEGPARRRRFLDWGVFHVEPDFMGYWQKFHQALRQRNAALRARQPRTLILAWDSDLARYGALLSEARERYVSPLAVAVAEIGRRLLDHEPTISYRRGWPRDAELISALEASLALDQERGFTQIGPQRAELQISLGGSAVRDRVSRGQQKLLSATLLLAQVRLFPPTAAVQPTLLLDDPGAELDDARLGALIREVSAQQAQLVVTTLHADFEALGTPGRRYRLLDGTLEADG
jgi:DNA replication and repair protein RecF